MIWLFITCAYLAVGALRWAAQPGTNLLAQLLVGGLFGLVELVWWLLDE